MKRKRCTKRSHSRSKRQRKEANGDDNNRNRQPADIYHPVLQCYFSRVTSLRQYILEKVSKKAQARIRGVENKGDLESVVGGRHGVELSFLLDTTLIAFEDNESDGCATASLCQPRPHTQHLQRLSIETSLSPNVSQSRQLSDVCPAFLL